MIAFQVWAEAWLRSFTGVAAFMQQQWSWPVAESVHFVGLTLLLGAIATWDLRLVGFMKQAPAAAFHKLIPVAVAGFTLNAVTGALFLMTFPDQYVYNAAFHVKLLCLLLAGLNVLVFYLTTFRRLSTQDAGEQAPVLGRISGALSVALWLSVIVCGRMITFLRPSPCAPGEAAGLIAQCIVR
jgi:hypothetical protein